MSNVELLIEEIKQEGCPVCAQYRDTETGELRFNDKVLAAFDEGDAMLRGDIPANWHKSLDDLDKILGL